MAARRCILMGSLLVAAVAASLAAADPAGSGEFVKLFNGKNLDGFDTYLRDSGLNNDPQKVFQVRDGVIYVSGVEFGYFITKKEYE